MHDIFIPDGNEVIKETFSRLEISYCVSPNTLKSLNAIRIQDILSNIPTRDEYHLWVKCEIFDVDKSLVRGKRIETFISELNAELDNVENEPITLKLEIDKGKGNIISIYDFVVFEKYWSKISVIKLLNEFVELLNTYNHVTFLFLEEELATFYSNRIAFSSSVLEAPSHSIDIEKVKEHCHFGNATTYPCKPNDFFFNKTSR